MGPGLLNKDKGTLHDGKDNGVGGRGHSVEIPAHSACPCKVPFNCYHPCAVVRAQVNTLIFKARDGYASYWSNCSFGKYRINAATTRILRYGTSYGVQPYGIHAQRVRKSTTARTHAWPHMHVASHA